MDLRKEIHLHTGNTELDNSLLDLFKKWVLEVIGEDEPDDGNLDSRFWENRVRREIRDRIKKEIK